MATLIAVGVAHQTARPRLARILDLEELRLGVNDEAEVVGRTARERIARLMGAHGGVDPGVAALDILNLTRGMIDGALDAQPSDLVARISRAVWGYLGL